MHERPEESVGRVDPAWDAARVESALDGLHRTRRRRVALRAGGAVLASSVLVWMLVGQLRVEEPRAARATPIPETEQTEQALELPDGSSVEPRDDDSRVVVREVVPERVRLELVAGAAHFSVRPDAARVFAVEAGPVRVEVLGTEFDVSLVDEGADVSVSRGRVRVVWSGGERILEAGDAGRFPEVQEPDVTPEPQVRATEPPTRARRDWRRPANQGEYEEALALLSDESVRDDVADLMLAADVLRYSGHAARAVPYLERVFERHPHDPRAALAAFTAGRVRLERLGQPREAAAAFARARRLEPTSSLAQDALAREAQAWDRAGDSAEARRCATEYLQRHPNGRRVEMMRRLADTP